MMRQLLLSFCVALLFFSFVVVCTADPDDNSDGTNRDKRCQTHHSQKKIILFTFL